MENIWINPGRSTLWGSALSVCCFLFITSVKRILLHLQIKGLQTVLWKLDGPVYKSRRLLLSSYVLMPAQRMYLITLTTRVPNMMICGNLSMLNKRSYLTDCWGIFYCIPFGIQLFFPLFLSQTFSLPVHIYCLFHFSRKSDFLLYSTYLIYSKMLSISTDMNNSKCISNTFSFLQQEYNSCMLEKGADMKCW